MPKVFLPGSTGCYWPHKMFGDASISFDDFQDNPQDYSLVVLPGGADIDPEIYGHPRNPKTSTWSSRDVLESAAVDLAVKHNIPIAGICRGGQMLIAKAGGYLYQHVTGHHSSHLVRTQDGQEFTVTSCHHQMFGWPLPKKSELIAWSSVHRSTCYELGDGESKQPPVYEPECVFLPEIKALATQWHPEWMNNPADTGTRYYQFLLEKYLRPLAAKKFHSLA